MAVNATYYFSGFPSLSYGRRIEPTFHLSAPGTVAPRAATKGKAAPRQSSKPVPGVYRARDAVNIFSPLLEAIIARLGPDKPGAPSSRDTLIDGLALLLATSGRESTLPLQGSQGQPRSIADKRRLEIKRQAERIGKTLVRYAAETAEAGQADPRLVLRSRCEGHLWSIPAAELLLGRRSSSSLMQLYNEWTHRLVLLRDALIPFENYDEVPLVVELGGSHDDDSRGMRRLEAPRRVFLTRVFSGQVAQRDLVDLAKALTGGEGQLPPGGFGFQYAHGTILPAFLGGSSSANLLRYYPAQEGGGPQDPVLFDYEFENYESAPRVGLPRAADEASLESTLRTSPVAKSTLRTYPFSGSSVDHASRAMLKLDLEFRDKPGKAVSVCLGQIARGRRYATVIPKSTTEAGRQVQANSSFHNGEDALFLSGLVDSVTPPAHEKEEETQHIFPISDPLISLALFGKLYPGNIVVLDKSSDWTGFEGVARGFGTRFVLWQGHEAQGDGI